jgi:hypothetical protein
MNFLYRPIALLSVVSLILASTLTGLSVSADTSDSNHTPQGQLTRRGLTGTVVGVGGSNFILETKFGNVTIDVDGGTVIKSGGEIVDFDVLSVGDRVGVLLDRPPDAPGKTAKDGGGDGPDLTPPESGDDSGTDPDFAPLDTSDDTGTDPDATPTPTVTVDLTTPSTTGDTSTDPDLTPPSTSDDSGTETEPTPTPTPAPSFRQGVTALKITIVPARASRSHKRGVVTSKGKIKFLDMNGEEQELEGDDDADEGDDVVFITRGKKGGGSTVTGSTDPGNVDDRLTRFAESHPKLAAKITKKKADARAKRDERLAKTLGNAPANKRGHVQGAIDKKNNRGRGNADNNRPGNTGTGSSDSGNSGNSGKGSPGGDRPDPKGDRGNSDRGSSDRGSSGSGNSSASGNSGNSGGGNGKSGGKGPK